MTSQDKMQFVNAAANFSDLEGDIASSNKPSSTINNNASSTAINMQQSAEERPSTLDEPVLVTINRDLKAVGYKFAHVFFPKKSQILLQDWDLWGPLSLCVLLSISLQANNDSKSSDIDNAPEFASVFALIGLGATVVTINTKLLSGKISFFQSICVLGYCLLPLVIVSLIHDIFAFIMSSSINTSLLMFIIHFSLVVLACGWSVFASTAFLAADTINLNDRKGLAIYPIFLFYFVISWLIVLDRK